MDTIVSAPIIEATLENTTETDSPDLVPDNSNCDQPVSKEPNDVYRDICKGFTLVFDSKTMLKPKSRVTTPTTPTTPTRRHQRTLSVASNKIWTDSPDSPLVIKGKQTPDSEKIHQKIEENLTSENLLSTKAKNEENKFTGKENQEKLENGKNKKIANGGQEEISKIYVNHNLQSATNGKLRNEDYRKFTQSIILQDAQNTPLWKTAAIFLYYHFTAAIGIFLVLSSQVMWQTIAFTLTLHGLSAFGVSANFIKRFIPHIFNLNLIYNVLSSVVIPSAIPWYMWEENFLTAFLVVAQVGYCLHWYGSWFAGRKEKVT